MSERRQDTIEEELRNELRKKLDYGEKDKYLAKIKKLTLELSEHMPGTPKEKLAQAQKIREKLTPGGKEPPKLLRK